MFVCEDVQYLNSISESSSAIHINLIFQISEDGSEINHKTKTILPEIQVNNSGIQ